MSGQVRQILVINILNKYGRIYMVANALSIIVVPLFINTQHTPIADTLPWYAAKGINVTSFSVFHTAVTVSFGP